MVSILALASPLSTREQSTTGQALRTFLVSIFFPFQKLVKVSNLHVTYPASILIIVGEWRGSAVSNLQNMRL